MKADFNSMRRMRDCIHRAIVPGVLALAMLAPSGAHAASAEYRLRAAYLYQFTKFITWPESTGAEIVVGVFGHSPMSEAIGTIENKVSRGKTIQVKRLSNPAELADCCDVVYVSTSEEHRLDEIFHAIGENPVLTVNETEEFMQQGGMINFIRRGTRLKFVVNVESARKRGLSLSSELLKVAKLYTQ